MLGNELKYKRRDQGRNEMGQGSCSRRAAWFIHALEDDVVGAWRLRCSRKEIKITMIRTVVMRCVGGPSGKISGE